MKESRKNTDLREHLNFMPVFCLFKASLFLTAFLLSEKEKILMCDIRLSLLSF